MNIRLGRLRTGIAFVMVICIAMAFAPIRGVYAAENTDDVQKIVDNMTLRQKITQCMMIDFRKWNNEAGETVDMTKLNPEVAELLAEYQFGSVILFAENIKETEDTLALNKDIQAATMSKGGKPLLIATDQEGGLVYRLGSGTAMPGNMAMGATFDPENAEIAGTVIGSELESVGINTTLAPVLDVNNNANNPVIGVRSFSDEPYTVGTMGSRYIDGLVQQNVIGCAKHFPGHGDTATDSHYGLPIVDKSLEQLWDCELKPFQLAIDRGVDMIMTAHILYPQVDDTKILSDKTGMEESRPATMSEKILTGLLRGDMGYQGVVVTDALFMEGIKKNFTMEQATLEAIKAGADLVCMPLTKVYDKAVWIERMESIINYVSQAVEADTKVAAKLDAAVTRVLTLKKNKGILEYDPSMYTPERATQTVGNKEHRALEREMAAKAVTVIRNEANTLPLEVNENTRILMLAPYENERAQMLMGLNRAKAAGLVPMNTRVWSATYGENNYEIKGELAKQLDWADIVIIHSEISSAARMDYSHWLSAGPKLYTEYCKANQKRSVIVAVNRPYDVQLYPAADAIMAVYGAKGSNATGMPQLVYGEMVEATDACGPNIVAGMEVAFGVFGASGKLPVNVPVYDPSTKSYTEEIAYARGYGLTYKSLQPAVKKASVKTLKSGKKKLTVTMTTKPSAKGGTHYQIAYKVKGSKGWSYKKTAAAKATVKGLKHNKKYVVKVRAYKNDSGRSFYGAWSRTRTSGKIK